MKFNITNKGLTLIEIVISMAIISIIAVSMLSIFGTGFSNIFKFGRNSKDYYEAGGELEISILNPFYEGKESTLSIVNEIVEIDIFDKKVKTRFIKSKIGDLSSPLGANDKYLFIYTVDQNLQVYEPGQAFISISGKNIYELGDIPVPKQLLEGRYRYVGKGRLVIPSAEAIMENTIHSINWDVKDGIYILPSVNNTTLDIKSTGGISLSSLKGDIILNDVIINSGGKIAMNSGKNIELRESIIKSNLNDVSIKSFGYIDLRGSDSKPTEISVKENTDKITFITNDKIFLNNKTKFIKNGVADWAINENNTTLETANGINGNNFK